MSKYNNGGVEIKKIGLILAIDYCEHLKILGLTGKLKETKEFNDISDQNSVIYLFNKNLTCYNSTPYLPSNNAKVLILHSKNIYFQSNSFITNLKIISSLLEIQISSKYIP